MLIIWGGAGGPLGACVCVWMRGWRETGCGENGIIGPLAIRTEREPHRSWSGTAGHWCTLSSPPHFCSISQLVFWSPSGAAEIVEMTAF